MTSHSSAPKQLRLIIFGGESFRSGGSDEGAGFWAFTILALCFALWSFALLVVGVD